MDCIIEVKITVIPILESILTRRHDFQSKYYDCPQFIYMGKIQLELLKIELTGIPTPCFCDRIYGMKIVPVKVDDFLKVGT